MDKKHGWKRRNCSYRAISLFPTVFSKDLYSKHVKTRACLGKVNLYFPVLSIKQQPCPGGSVVCVLDSRPGGCEFDPWLRRIFFPADFLLSPLQKHLRKVVGGFGKKSCVSTGVRKPGNTYASPTAMI